MSSGIWRWDDLLLCFPKILLMSPCQVSWWLQYKPECECKVLIAYYDAEGETSLKPFLLRSHFEHQSSQTICDKTDFRDPEQFTNIFFALISGLLMIKVFAQKCSRLIGLLFQRASFWKMAAEGEKVEKEKVLPKDAQVGLTSHPWNISYILIWWSICCAGDGGHFEGHGHQWLRAQSDQSNAGVFLQVTHWPNKCLPSTIPQPRYVTGILEDARVYSSHARKKTLDTEDVKLAVQLAAEQVNLKTCFDKNWTCCSFRVSPHLHQERLSLS